MSSQEKQRPRPLNSEKSSKSGGRRKLMKDRGLEEIKGGASVEVTSWKSSSEWTMPNYLEKIH
jgi:hypothetical protein